MSVSPPKDNSISFHTTQALQYFVISTLDFCNSLLESLPLCAIFHLQLIQNAADQLIFKFSKLSHNISLLLSIHWCPVAVCIRFSKH